MPSFEPVINGGIGRIEIERDQDFKGELARDIQFYFSDSNWYAGRGRDAQAINGYYYVCAQLYESDGVIIEPITLKNIAIVARKEGKVTAVGYKCNCTSVENDEVMDALSVLIDNFRAGGSLLKSFENRRILVRDPEITRIPMELLQ